MVAGRTYLLFPYLCLSEDYELLGQVWPLISIGFPPNLVHCKDYSLFLAICFSLISHAYLLEVDAKVEFGMQGI